jgi:F0F1-type ATP synthase assembly protein I
MSTEPTAPHKTTEASVNKGMSLGQAFSLAWEMGYTMAIPLVVLALGGRLLDKYLKTSPLFLLIGIGFSIAISSLALARKATKIMADLETEEKEANPK